MLYPQIATCFGLEKGTLFTIVKLDTKKTSKIVLLYLWPVWEKKSQSGKSIKHLHSVKIENIRMLGFLYRVRNYAASKFPLQQGFQLGVT